MAGGPGLPPPTDPPRVFVCAGARFVHLFNLRRTPRGPKPVAVLAPLRGGVVIVDDAEPVYAHELASDYAPEPSQVI